jgi:hypothetical protein
VSESYEAGEILRVEGARNTFDEMVREKKWFRGDELVKPGMMEKAKELFCKEIEKIAERDGQVRSWLRFYMAVGRRLSEIESS